MRKHVVQPVLLSSVVSARLLPPAGLLLPASGGDHYRDLPTAVLPASFAMHPVLVPVPSVLRIRRGLGRLGRLRRLPIRVISVFSS